MARPERGWHLDVVRLPPGGTDACVVVVADTHSVPHPALPGLLERLHPVVILHAGDIGDLGVLDALTAHAPVYAVRGNIDGYTPEVPEDRVIDIEGGPAGTLRILLVHVAVYGPRLRKEVAARAAQVGAGLVVCGHSHVPFLGRDKGVVVFNAGSVGPRRFQLPIVFGTLTFGADGVRLAHISAETGEEWRPA